MGKKGKKAQAGKPKKLTLKDVGKRLDVLVKKLGEELEGSDLFAPLPPTEDCAICLVPLSRMAANSVYKSCCGNTICVGCARENEASIKKQNEEKNAGKKVALACPFCRELPPSSDDEYVRRLEARALKNDHNALRNLGCHFEHGSDGFPKDYLKALDCWIKAVELGSPGACTNIGTYYSEGKGVSKDMDRKALFYTVGSLRGCIYARNNIGFSEYNSGNREIGIRHWTIAAQAGHQLSLDALKDIYNADGKLPGKEFISKECMDSLYRVCHDAQEEVKSEGREKHCDRDDMKC